MPAVDLLSVVASSPIVGVVSAGDPGSSRLVYAMVIGLVAIGIGLILLAIWILRQTRPDLDVLAPLERMGDGDWKKRDPSTQRRMLDEVRPEGAQPLAAEPLPPPIDRDFEQADHEVASFSDLGPGIGGDVDAPTSVQSDADDQPDQTTDESVDEAPDDPVAEDDAPHEPADEEASEPADEEATEPADEEATEPDDEAVDEAPDDPVAEDDAPHEPADKPADEAATEPEDEPDEEEPGTEPPGDADDEPIDAATAEPGDEGVDDQADDALSDPRG